MSFSCGSRRILSQLPVRFPMLSEAASYLKTTYENGIDLLTQQESTIPKMSNYIFKILWETGSRVVFESYFPPKREEHISIELASSTN